MDPTRRIIDANANRAREALRVIEEAARFVLNDTPLTSAIKKLRHDLAAALKQLPGIELHRDTPGDVGTAITMKSESSRAGVYDVVVAAGKRFSEALRAMEEYGKTIDTPFAAAIEQLRYRGYAIESQLHARLGSPHRRQFKLCVLISESLCEHHNWLDVAKAALDGGADMLQLREKLIDDSELLERACRLVQLTGQRIKRAGQRAGRSPAPKSRVRGRTGSPAIVVNDRPDIALLSGADGVHLGRGDLPIDAVRKLVGPRLLIGASTHNLREAAAAIRAGADYCGVGAMFPTATKQRKPAGPAYMRKFVERFADTPHLAIGGITPDNVNEVVAAGAKGVAVSACVCGAKKPATVVRKLLKVIG